MQSQHSYSLWLDFLGRFTIFAPTNAAFSALPASTLTALGNDVTALQNVLKYHVVPGSVYKSVAFNELKVRTFNGQSIRFNVYQHVNKVTIEGSEIIQFDRKAINGVIHVINKVMVPPTGDIVDLVVKTPAVSTLLSLVQRAGIANALKTESITVFAPTNDAFARLPQAVVSQITSDPNLLREVLEYHVVPHTEYSAGLYDGELLPTLDSNHDTIQVHVDSTGVRVNQNGHVTTADVDATNGVVHLIDNVLIPARYYLSIIGRK